MGHWMVERVSDLCAGKLFQAAWNKVPRRTNFRGNKIFVPGRRAAHSELGSTQAGPGGLRWKSPWNSDTGFCVRNYRDSLQSIKQWTPYLASEVYSGK